MWTTVFVVWTLSSTISGQFVRIGTACSNDKSVYTCSREADELRWDFERNGVNTGRFLFLAEFTTAGEIFDRVVEFVIIYFNVTSASDSFVSVTATINDTSLNGIRMSCAGEILDIEMMPPILPSMLHISKNGSSINITPVPTSSGLMYYLELPTQELAGYINNTLVLEKSNKFDNITFICFNQKSTFFLGACLIQDNVNDRMYINYGSSDNWTIIQDCIICDITTTSVKCLNDSSWNMQPQCPDYSSPEILSTYGTTEASVIKEDQQRLFSFSSLQITGVIIGVITVSLMVGIVVGIFIGILGMIKYYQNTKYELKSKDSTKIHTDIVPTTTTKDVVYDEIEMKSSNIETSKNLAYGNIKKQ